MACCNVKNDKTSGHKNFDEIYKHFDMVQFEEMEQYYKLTLKDKAPISYDMDWIVWLDLSIAKVPQNPNKENRDMQCVEEVCKTLMDWIDILKNPIEEQPSQLSLFGDELDVEEKMPDSPKTDGGWSKYHKECDRIAKNRLKKKYTFLELFDYDFYRYNGIDFRQSLPSNDEFKALFKKGIKEAIEIGLEANDWFDVDEYNISYLQDEDGLSDIELIARLGGIRVHLVPYVDYFKASYDLSYTDHSARNKERELRNSHRFYFDRGHLTHSWGLDPDKIELPSYDIFDEELLLFIRELLNISYRDYLTDDDVLKENLERYIDSMLGYKKDGYDWQNKIKTFKNYKAFEKDLLSYLKENDVDYKNGGCSGYGEDGYSAWIDRFGKGKLSIEHKKEARLKMGLPIDDLETASFSYDTVVVCELIGSQIFEKAFEIFAKDENVKETTIFDFLVA